jgi:hypothetical protein
MRADAAVLLCLLARTAAAQVPAPMPGDSMTACAVREANAAGFRAVPNANRSGRIALMRPNETPGPRYLLDALGISTRADSTGEPVLQVKVGSFMVSKTSMSQDEVPPRPSLAAFGDSLKARCGGGRR